MVLAIDPAHEGAAGLLADSLTGRGEPEEAVRVLDQTIGRRPDSHDLRMSAAILMERLGRTAEAQTRYERLLADHPRVVQAAYRLAALYAARGERLDRALQLASMARWARPEDPAASDALGLVLIRRDLPGAALPLFQDAVRAAPANAVYRYHLGLAYARIGVNREARVELSRALELDPAFPDAADARAILSSIGR
jgi:Flp pilus assembly protein TadD